MKRLNVFGKLSVLALVLVASASHAEVVKYDFTAHGTSASYGGGAASDFPSTAASAYLPASSTLSGSFFYDTTLNAVFTGPNYNDYYSSTGIGVTLTSSAGYHFANNVTTEFGQPSVHIDDSNPEDLVRVAASEIDSHGASNDVTLTLTGKGTQVLTASGLPHSLSLNDFNGVVTIYWTDGTGKEFNYSADIDTLTVAAAVPEAETYAMLLAGLALVGVARRRKQNQASA
jgi:hypothetical protein